MRPMTPAPELNKPRQVLKPCPFCGGEAEISPYMGYGNMDFYMITCDACNVRMLGEAGERVNRNEVIEAWNRRAE